MMPDWEVPEGPDPPSPPPFGGWWSAGSAGAKARTAPAVLSPGGPAYETCPRGRASGVAPCRRRRHAGRAGTRDPGRVARRGRRRERPHPQGCSPGGRARAPSPGRPAARRGRRSDERWSSMRNGAMPPGRPPAGSSSWPRPVRPSAGGVPCRRDVRQPVPPPRGTPPRDPSRGAGDAWALGRGNGDARPTRWVQSGPPCRHRHAGVSLHTAPADRGRAR